MDLIRLLGHPQQAIEAVRLEEGAGEFGVLLEFEHWRRLLRERAHVRVFVRRR